MADTATTQATENARQWIEQQFESKISQPPFSFIYDGKPSDKLLGTWELQRDQKKLDEGTHATHVLRYTDRNTGLEVRCEAVKILPIIAAIDWVVYFQNIGDQDTAISGEHTGAGQRVHLGAIR